MTTWGTVSLVDEPVELLLAFAAWHLHAGASEIHLFLDRARPEDAEKLGALPGVIVTLCDSAFWKENGGRKNLQTGRQAVVANLVYAKTKLDWLAHIDADEFLVSQTSIASELGALPAGVQVMKCPVRERAWPVNGSVKSIFDGLFRVPMSGGQRVMEAIMEFESMFADRGLFGHTSGKTFVRTGLGKMITMGIHTPECTQPLTRIDSKLTKLLHFDGLTPFHWLVKRMRYGTLPHAEKHVGSENYRWVQIQTMREMPSVWHARRFQKQVIMLSDERIAQLSALGLLVDAPKFEPIKAIQAVLPGREVDLSIGRFNRSIRARDAEMLTQIDVRKGRKSSKGPA